MVFRYPLIQYFFSSRFVFLEFFSLLGVWEYVSRKCHLLFLYFSLSLRYLLVQYCFSLFSFVFLEFFSWLGVWDYVSTEMPSSLSLFHSLSLVVTCPIFFLFRFCFSLVLFLAWGAGVGFMKMVSSLSLSLSICLSLSLGNSTRNHTIKRKSHAKLGERT